MSKIFYVIIAVIIVLIVAGIAGAAFYLNALPAGRQAKPADNQVVCTMEAKLCPDGSYVARSGPKCEFAACPVAKEEGIVKGKVTVGPICPVERIDVPCPVPPEAYTSREVILYAANGTTEIKRMHFLADGTYSFEVLAGKYIIDIPKQGIGGGSDLPKTITVNPGQTIEFNFSIDTGIR